jgi:MerR, DNA binding
MNQPVSYCVRITRRGPFADRFGWAIRRQDNLLEVQRSAKTFETRIEALLDSVHAAQELAFPLEIDIPGPSDGHPEPAISQKQFDVGKAAALGFSPDAISQLVELVERSAESCAEVKAIAEQQLENIKRRIGDLQCSANALALLVSGCSPAMTVAECPIVQALTGG